MTTDCPIHSLVSFCLHRGLLTVSEASELEASPAGPRVELLWRRFLSRKVTFNAIAESLREESIERLGDQMRTMYEEAGCSIEASKQIALVEKRNHGHDHNLTYGEIDFSSFASIMHSVQFLRGNFDNLKFYDLGKFSHLEILRSSYSIHSFSHFIYLFIYLFIFLLLLRLMP